MTHTIFVKPTAPEWHNASSLFWVEFAWPVPNEERDYTVLVTHQIREILENTLVRAYADGTFEIHAPEGVPLDGYQHMKPGTVQ